MVNYLDWYFKGKTPASVKKFDAADLASFRTHHREEVLGKVA